MISLTPQEHEHSAIVDEAARWLATNPPEQRSRAVILLLRERFGMSAMEACEAVKQAGDIRKETV